MRIFAAGIATETNTFSPIPTSLEDFLVKRGKDALGGKVDSPSLDLAKVWGGLVLTRGDEFIFTLMARAEPSGITARSAYETLRDELLKGLEAAMPVDIVLLMLHGAMVAQGYDDCEEDLIRCVRHIVGEEAVIGVELDLHCHLSPAKIAAADIVITFKEYPHVDRDERAKELFQLAVETKLGRIRPVMSLFDCQMIGLYPTTREPLQAFVNAMKEAEKRKGVLSVSFGHGFQFADLPHVGAKVLVVTDGDIRLAEKTAREFGLRVYQLRQEIGFESFSISLHDALTKAFASQATPVVLADQSDNAGAGAPGDATFVLRELLERKAESVAMAIFYDPQVVKIAKRAGIGATLSIRLGGKLGAASGDPVDMEATVLSMLENYMHAFPQLSGGPRMFPIGDVAALRYGGIDIVVASERCQCFSPSIFSDLGIDPASKRLLVVKSTQHFFGAFAPIAGEVIYMTAPGAVPPNPRLISYHRLNTRALYPWTQDPLMCASC